MTPFIGNARAVGGVQRALAGGSPPHAWLFVGPEGVGKATLARWLAQAVNCEALMPDAGVGARHAQEGLEADAIAPNEAISHPTDTSGASPLQGAVEPCGECPQCRRIEGGIHSDVQTVTVEPTSEGSQRTAISVDQIREVERAVALNPFEGRTRVVIIDPADEMSDSAQNAFLKTLEEPPPHTIFVLIASREGKLLSTIHSRCRRVELRLVPVGEIEAALLGAEALDGEQARLLARLSGGRIGWALEAAREPDRLKKRREVLEQARALGAISLAERFDLAERLVKVWRDDREDVFGRLEGWRGWYRDVLLVQSAAEEGVANVDMLAELREEARAWSREGLVTVLEAIGRCREQLRGNVQARIALDALMVCVPRVMVESRK